MKKDKNLKCDKCKKQVDELMAINDLAKENLTWLCKECYTARHGEFPDVEKIIQD
jgi:hypothetical protein